VKNTGNRHLGQQQTAGFYEVKEFYAELKNIEKLFPIDDKFLFLYYHFL